MSKKSSTLTCTGVCWLQLHSLRAQSLLLNVTQLPKLHVLTADFEYFLKTHQPLHSRSWPCWGSWPTVCKTKSVTITTNGGRRRDCFTGCFHHNIHIILVTCTVHTEYKYSFKQYFMAKRNKFILPFSEAGLVLHIIHIYPQRRHYHTTFPFITQTFVSPVHNIQFLQKLSHAPT
jgi:hypothetical protein